jgi:hypothetical protein
MMQICQWVSLISKALNIKVVLNRMKEIAVRDIVRDEEENKVSLN